MASLDLDRALWRAVLNDYLAHPKVSVTDAFLAAQARSEKALPLYTFDRKLASQLAGAELPALTDRTGPPGHWEQGLSGTRRSRRSRASGC